jgi:hypothetical protein
MVIMVTCDVGGTDDNVLFNNSWARLCTTVYNVVIHNYGSKYVMANVTQMIKVPLYVFLLHITGLMFFSLILTWATILQYSILQASLFTLYYPHDICCCYVEDSCTQWVNLEPTANTSHFMHVAIYFQVYKPQDFIFQYQDLINSNSRT